MSTVNSEVYTAAGNILREIVKENGADIISDTKALGNKLTEKGLGENTVYQLLLIIKTSNITRYIPQISTGISMIDVNNIISCAEENSGLSKRTVKELVSCILYGLSLPTDIAKLSIPDEGTYKVKETYLLDFKEYEEELSILDAAVENMDAEAIAEHAETLEKLARAGHPDALYYKGMCYLKGISVSKNPALAKRYLIAATKSSCQKAEAALGDYYAEGDFPNYTLAFDHYTAVGSIALDKKRQENIKAIVQQKKANITTLVFSLIIFALTVVLNITVGSGAFSFDGSTNWVPAIFSIALNTLALGLGGYCLFKYRYNSIKWLIPAMAVITLFFTIIAL